MTEAISALPHTHNKRAEFQSHHHGCYVDFSHHTLRSLPDAVGNLGKEAAVLKGLVVPKQCLQKFCTALLETADKIN